MESVYLDVCCLNRPFNDQSQPRIRIESEAIRFVFTLVQDGTVEFVSSTVVQEEVDATPDPERLDLLVDLLSHTRRVVDVGEWEEDRAIELEAMGFRGFDALHIACAEAARVSALLTVDDRMLARARRLADLILIPVYNPVDWIQLGERI